jgi:hypothetical protein
VAAATIALMLAGSAVTLALGSDAGRPRVAVVAATDPNTPAGVVLRFWRDVQSKNYPGAYAALDPNVKSSLPYASFLSTVVSSRPVFLRDPSVVRVVAGLDFGQVQLASSRAGVVRSDSPVLAFNVRRVLERADHREHGVHGRAPRVRTSVPQPLWLIATSTGT